MSLRVPAFVELGSSNLQWGTPERPGAFSSLFCPTGQYRSEVGGPQGRETPSVYARGYSETVRLLPSNGVAWQWRRIVFRYKGNVYGSDFGFGADSQTVYFAPHGDSNSYGRLINQVSGNAFVNLAGMLFKGTAGIDWSNQFDAKIDTSRATLVSDVTRTLRSGNAEAHPHYFKLWYPFNKTLVYDDENIGDDKSFSSAYSAQGKMGMGDCYIYDIFAPEIGSVSTSASIRLNMTGAYYWHER